MTSKTQVAFAVPSYLHDHVVPALAKKSRARAIRALILPPDAIQEHIADARLDGALTLGFEPTTPPAWERVRISTLRSTLFASPRIAASLGPTPRLEDVLALRFVGAVYGDDRCPVPSAERALGHRVESMRQACAIAAETEELVYGPELAAGSFVADGRLVEVHLFGWPRFDSVHLVFDPVAFEGIDDVVDTVSSALTRSTRTPATGVQPTTADRPHRTTSPDAQSRLARTP